MVLLPFALTLLACARDPAPAASSAEGTSAVAPEPTPPAAPPLHARLLEAGVCASEGTVSHTEAVVLAEGRTVLVVQCALFAYQGTYELAWAKTHQPVLDQDGSGLSLVGLPALSPEGTLTWTSLDRGAGDCGHVYRYTLKGDRFVEEEHRYRPCPAVPEDAPPPEAWPLVSEIPEARR